MVNITIKNEVWIINLSADNQDVIIILMNFNMQKDYLVRHECWNTSANFPGIFKAMTKNNSITFKDSIRTRFYVTKVGERQMLDESNFNLTSRIHCYLVPVVIEMLL